MKQYVKTKILDFLNENKKYDDFFITFDYNKIVYHITSKPTYEILDFLNENKNNELIVYHGTNKSFSNFELEHTSIFNLYGRGFYFTDSLDIAKSYIGGILNRKTSESHIKEYLLLVNNIYDFD
jgi:hypothetical protein